MYTQHAYTKLFRLIRHCLPNAYLARIEKPFFYSKERLNILDRMILRGLQALYNKSSDKNHLMEYVWSSPTGKAWYDEFPVDLTTDKSLYEATSTSIQQIQSLITDQAAGYFEFLEIGTADGLMLNHLSNHLVTIDKFIGVDLNPLAIEQNRKKYKEKSKLHFFCDDAENFIAQKRGKGIIIFASRSFTCVTQEKLENILRLTAQNFTKAIIALQETCHPDFESYQSSIHRPNTMMYLHNYPALLSKYGFEILHSENFGINKDFIVIVAKKADHRKSRKIEI